MQKKLSLVGKFIRLAIGTSHECVGLSAVGDLHLFRIVSEIGDARAVTDIGQLAEIRVRLDVPGRILGCLCEVLGVHIAYGHRLAAAGLLETPHVAATLSAGADHGMVDRLIGRDLPPCP